MTDNPSQNAERLEKQHHELLFGIRRSVRYHMRRRRFFELWHTVTNALGVIFGSAAVVTILGKFDPIVSAIAASLVAILSTIDLFAGTASMARQHSDLAKRFIALEKELTLAGEPTQEIVRTFTARRLEIEEEEPPVMRTLDRLCHNELLRAMGYPNELFVKIPLYQRLLAHFISFESHHYIAETSPQQLGR